MQCFTYECDSYTISCDDNGTNWKLLMRTYNLPIRTQNLIHNERLLQLYLPSIFKCTCYNDYNAPFSQELKDTELGHLFEHILLEYLCIQKLKGRTGKAVFCGRTSWNWQRDPRGVYHQSIRLFNAIVGSYQKTPTLDPCFGIENSTTIAAETATVGINARRYQ